MRTGLRRNRYGVGQVNGLDLTPMLDMLFILLVFFLLTSGAALQSLELELPQSVAEELPQQEATNHILLQIKPDGYKLGDRSYSSLDDLKETLQSLLATDGSRQLHIASDRSVTADRLLGMLTYLQTVGIPTANILLDRKY